MEQDEWVSIGEVCRATGLSAHTLRVWERRYGRPVPVRLPSGHRRFKPEQVRWLRRVTEALSLGHRPSRILPLDEGELSALLDVEVCTEAPPEAIRELLEPILAFDGAQLAQRFEDEWKKEGRRTALFQLVVPFLHSVGRWWADGEIGIRHEHFASELVRIALAGYQRSLDLPDRDPSALLATLAGEQHGLGLELAELVFGLHGLVARNLGPNLPVEEIAQAAEAHPGAVVGISVSLANGGVDTDRVVQELLAAMPAETPLLVGGAGGRGMRRGVRGALYFSHLSELDHWLSDQVQQGRIG